jgi:hypothetical protein
MALSSGEWGGRNSGLRLAGTAKSLAMCQPARSMVHEDHGMDAWADLLAEFVEHGLHRGRAHRRQDQGDAGIPYWTDGTEQVGRLVAQIAHAGERMPFSNQRRQTRPVWPTRASSRNQTSAVRPRGGRGRPRRSAPGRSYCRRPRSAPRRPGRLHLAASQRTNVNHTPPNSQPQVSQNIAGVGISQRPGSDSGGRLSKSSRDCLPHRLAPQFAV